MTTARPTPEAIAADIHATAQAHKAGVITDRERACRLLEAWDTARMHALTDATIRALATSEANACPFGPDALDVLLAAETADPGAVCDAIEAIADGGAGVGVTSRGDITMSRATLAAIVRALCGGSHGA